MNIDILTLFPEMFNNIFNHSIIKRAHEKNQFTYNIINFRDYTINKHQKVDDYPYGGGAGMVLTPQPIFDAIEAIKTKNNSRPRSEERRVGKKGRTSRRQ